MEQQLPLHTRLKELANPVPLPPSPKIATILPFVDPHLREAYLRREMFISTSSTPREGFVTFPATISGPSVRALSIQAVFFPKLAYCATRLPCGPAPGTCLISPPPSRAASPVPPLPNICFDDDMRLAQEYEDALATVDVTDQFMFFDAHPTNT